MQFRNPSMKKPDHVIEFSDKDGLLVIHIKDGKEMVYFPKNFSLENSMKKPRRILFEFRRK